MKIDTDEGPRWAPHSIHHQKNLDLYRFIGRLDDFDVYLDLEEVREADASFNGTVLVNNHDDFNRVHIEADGSPRAVYSAPEITFDQMCLIMNMAEQQGLLGPNPSHPEWGTAA